MAKKSSSSAKKVVKKVAPAKAKVVAKKAAKAPVKPAPKVAAKPAAKPVKQAPVKASKKEMAKAAVPEKVKSIPTKPVKEVVKSKPSVMSKKAVEPEIKDEAGEEVAAVEEAGSSKAEKNSKIKAIRIEKGNSADEKAKWAELSKKYGKEKAANYKMSDTFVALTPIQHKVLGWGFILSNENDRLEVLFETGIRMLISNYKS